MLRIVRCAAGGPGGPLARLVALGLGVAAGLWVTCGGSVPAAQAAVPRGKADVYTSPASVAGLAAGSTFTLSVAVEPNGVQVDAAAATLTFDARYLEVDGASLAAGGDLPAVLGSAVDNGAGSVFFAATRLGGPWPSAAFTLLSLTFRVTAAAPGALGVGLVSTGRGGTDVASNGASVLNAVHGSTLAFGAPGTATALPAAGATPAPPAATPASAAAPATPAPATVPSPSPAPAAPGGSGAGAGGGSSGAGSGGAGSGGSGGSGAGGSSGGSGAGSGSAGGGAAAPPPGVAPGAPGVLPVPPPPPAPGAAVPVGAASAGGPLAPPAAGPPASLPGMASGDAVPPLPPAVQVAVAPVAAGFQDFYVQRQGLRVLGSTLAAAQPLAGGGVAQYFEKGRVEDHPEESNPAWRVQYGLLVDELIGAAAPLPVGGDASTVTYATLQQLTQPAVRVPPPADFPGGTTSLPDGSVFVPFSAALTPGPGHIVPAAFWTYITSDALFPGGWLHDAGLPTTDAVEAVVDKGPDRGRHILVQAFQRTVLTYDPANPAEYTVERANVGTDYARAFPAIFS